MTTRRDLLRRIGVTAVLTTAMSALTAIFPEIANAASTYNGCQCRPGANAGVYCGWCDAVTNTGNGGAWSDVYLCSNSGSCCRYGPRPSCADSQNYSPCG
ncbi:hypothetical protein [Nocardia rhizosphaerihabitans]|uniref:Twin-arginine translocation signal domain-containing protein n=1 Tax=Nocardia rhizosphaerihabitans TaxID=1691570 RepID=A0ABQ2K5A3_9NOCA|nr:hypothetical protein [Nocardia rhizosphaerihabitans]GGN66018.1 hypothetical protein GCM10011610_00510 [Nocardia rhizosphaerihabitans]